jgi:hypothetical protein
MDLSMIVEGDIAGKAGSASQYLVKDVATPCSVTQLPSPPSSPCEEGLTGHDGSHPEFTRVMNQLYLVLGREMQKAPGGVDDARHFSMYMREQLRQSYDSFMEAFRIRCDGCAENSRKISGGEQQHTPKGTVQPLSSHEMMQRLVDDDIAYSMRYGHHQQQQQQWVYDAMALGLTDGIMPVWNASSGFDPMMSGGVGYFTPTTVQY